VAQRRPARIADARAAVANFARVKNRPAHLSVRKGRAGPPLGHVSSSDDFQKTFELVHAHARHAALDVLVAGPEKKKLVAFLRCRSRPPLSPTTTQSPFAEGPQAHLHHSSFEIHDFDDQALGHELAHGAGLADFWGIGRHVIGSQVFD